MNLQTHYDLAVAEARLSGRLEKEVAAYGAIRQDHTHRVD
jgi:hypothetical protein